MRRLHLLALACAWALPALALAAAPKLAYQGRILRSDGSPESGVVALRFALFEVPSGGQEVWSEEQQLAISDGFYAAFLGESSPLPEAALDGRDLYLELAAGGSPLSPRQKIASVPYAVRALTAQSVAGGKVEASEVWVGGQKVVDSTGKLAGPASYAAGAGLELAGNTFSLLGGCSQGQLLKWNGTAWACAADELGVTSVVAQAPLAGTGKQGDPLALAKASGSADGYLAAADFAAFSAKVGSVRAGAGVEVTGTVDPVVAVAFGSGAGKAIEGNDPRLADARDPKPGSAAYIQNQTGADQDASLRIAGSATVGSAAVKGDLAVDARLAVAGSAELAKASVAGDLSAGKLAVGGEAAVGNTTVNGTLGVGVAAPAAKVDVAGALRVADQAVTCDAAHAGTIRFKAGRFQGCNGAAWVYLDYAGPSGTQYRPGASCKAILDAGDSLGDGPYWLDPAGNGNAFQAWCNMSTDGGGWMLLASYRAGYYHNGHKILQAQQMTTGGGATPPAGWYPKPSDYGHFAFNSVNPSGRSVMLSCGPASNPLQSRYASTSLFADWAGGDHGSYGASGSPGWGILFAQDSGGNGRANHYLCGRISYASHWGIGYCNGPGADGSWGNHLASYSGYSGGSSIGCSGGEGQALQVWVR